MTVRKKSKTITLYVDPKYEDKLLYLKNTVGITTFIEEALDKLEVDQDKLELIKSLKMK